VCDSLHLHWSCTLGLTSCLCNSLGLLWDSTVNSCDTYVFLDIVTLLITLRTRPRNMFSHQPSIITYLLTYLLTPWPESASELYRPSDRRLSAKLVPIFADRGCCVISVTDPYGRILGFPDRKNYHRYIKLLSETSTICKCCWFVYEAVVSRAMIRFCFQNSVKCGVCLGHC
jgi:hypothetical protein